ncbi:MAG: hypothetical protein HY313_08610 [Acidobacteria bacterium]|nr:hypothetical protein [Acidobacteriota bacterium]
MKQLIHYFFIFPLISLVRTKEQYETCLKYYLIIALLMAGLLHLYALFPEYADPDVGTAFTTLLGGNVRVYSQGTFYVLLAAVGLLPFLRRNMLLVAAWLFLLFGLLPTFGRSFFLVLGICVALYLGWRVMLNPQRRQKVAGLLLALAVVMILVEFFSGGIVSTMAERMQTLEGLQTERLRDFDTLGWRIRDAENAISQVRTPWQMAVGAFAKPFSTEGAPLGVYVHLGWVGLYYHFGWLGVLVFGMLSLLISIKAVNLLHATRKQTLHLPTEWIVAFGLVWIAFCLFSIVSDTFAGGPAIISLILLWYGISFAEKPPSVETRRQKFRGIEWRTAQDLHRNPVLQPRGVHPGMYRKRPEPGLR